MELDLTWNSDWDYYVFAIKISNQHWTCNCEQLAYMLEIPLNTLEIIFIRWGMIKIHKYVWGTKDEIIFLNCMKEIEPYIIMYKLAH